MEDLKKKNYFDGLRHGWQSAPQYIENLLEAEEVLNRGYWCGLQQDWEMFKVWDNGVKLIPYSYLKMLGV